jgi:hypothetical protein
VSNPVSPIRKPETPSIDDLIAEMTRLSSRLDDAHAELVHRSYEWAKSENKYRLARANSYLASSGTVAEREARVDKATDTERLEAHTAEALKVAALESVRSVRAQLSACQSVANAVRSEMEMAR